MNTHSTTSDQLNKHALGNAAVDGLIAGAGGGIIMAAYLLLVMAILGESLLDLLSNFTTADMQSSPLMGVVAHLAVSAIYGMVFSVIWSAIRGGQRRLLRVISGFVYGLILFATAEWVILPAAQSPLLDIPVLHFAIAHAIYGVVLGLLLKKTL